MLPRMSKLTFHKMSVIHSMLSTSSVLLTNVFLRHSVYGARKLFPYEMSVIQKNIQCNLYFIMKDGKKKKEKMFCMVFEQTCVNIMYPYKFIQSIENILLLTKVLNFQKKLRKISSKRYFSWAILFSLYAIFDLAGKQK